MGHREGSHVVVLVFVVVLVVIVLIVVVLFDMGNDTTGGNTLRGPRGSKQMSKG